MAIDYDRLMNWRIPDAEQSYGPRDVMLYALGLGIGSDPLDQEQLRYVYEARLQALPTLAFVVGNPGPWFANPETGIDYTKLVNAGVSARFHRPLPTRADVVGQTKVIAVADKGAQRGALVVVNRQLQERGGGEPLADIRTTYLCRGDGGFGGPDTPLPENPAVPATAPDEIIAFDTLSQAALIYRLSGDDNPLHADPQLAAAAGFPRPILHGLCTLGIAGYVIIATAGGHDPSRLRLLEARFSAPVFPGETLLIDLWRTGHKLRFQARTLERGSVVLDNGTAELSVLA